MMSGIRIYTGKRPFLRTPTRLASRARTTRVTEPKAGASTAIRLWLTG
jgi:hypothetical protein